MSPAADAGHRTGGGSGDPPLRARAAVRALRASKIREVANAGMGRSDVLAFWFGRAGRDHAGFHSPGGHRRAVGRRHVLYAESGNP
jgi:hypothetical protein